MPPGGLSRSVSLPDLRSVSLLKKADSSRARSCSVYPELLKELKGASNCPSKPMRPEPDLSSLSEGLATQSLKALSCLGEPPDRLLDVYQGSSNFYARMEVAEFAKVFHQLSQQPNLDEESKSQLQEQARQYAALILKDGLGEESAFGPWTPKTDKGYQLRSQLEHKLAQHAVSLKGGVGQLSESFLAREVLPLAGEYLAHQLGVRLDSDAVRDGLKQFERAARQVFESLSQARRESMEIHGAGVGKLARDLDLMAVLPWLLRAELARTETALDADSGLAPSSDLKQEVMKDEARNESSKQGAHGIGGAGKSRAVPHAGGGDGADPARGEADRRFVRRLDGAVGNGDAAE
ncbi:hypothetical protein ACFFU8_04280 [Chromobacterium piscinae]|uniref:hypothetical protein n=2 Tax=Chromobacterium piscinae TaxID=686831 RepID=UPI0035EB5E6D|nr:hypothetical protein [Chromobacterium vaccinii]